MSTATIRNRLYEYIRFADEKKIKAIYTIVEEEINEKHQAWSKAFLLELKKRSKDLESGKVVGRSREEVKKKAKLLLNK